jgi:hypothetical protein
MDVKVINTRFFIVCWFHWVFALGLLMPSFRKKFMPAAPAGVRSSSKCPSAGETWVAEFSGNAWSGKPAQKSLVLPRQGRIAQLSGPPANKR